MMISGLLLKSASGRFFEKEVECPTPARKKLLA